MLLPEDTVPTGLESSAVGLRQLIIDNPDLPLLIFAGEDANCGGDYNYMSCSIVSAHIGEFLDCSQKVDDCRVFEDRDDFEERLADVLYDPGDTRTDEEWGNYIKEKVAEYDPYWKKCIILYVDN